MQPVLSSACGFPQLPLSAILPRTDQKEISSVRLLRRCLSEFSKGLQAAPTSLEKLRSFRLCTWALFGPRLGTGRQVFLSFMQLHSSFKDASVADHATVLERKIGTRHPFRTRSCMWIHFCVHSLEESVMAL